MSGPRRLVFVTGTRADFGKLEPLAVSARDAGYDVTFFVTGMHMLDRYGLTKLEVHRVAGVAIHEFLNQRVNDAQDTVLAKTVLGFSDFASEHRPDLVVLHGDRVEALACSIVCATNYIRCAHVEGGEVSGTIDELFRHCNSKLSSHHFVSSELAARRVMALGESRQSIHVIGSPELDFHGGPSGVTLKMVCARYEIPFEDFGICTLHPVTSEQDTMRAQAKTFFGALEQSGRNFVVILPNNDPGAEGILDVIQTLPRDRFRILPSMRFAHFSELMKNSACIVGNSSAGVREAPFLGVPSLNVGTRQMNRADSTSILNCNAEDTKAIATFMDQAWGKRYSLDAGFGDGQAAGKFVLALEETAFWERSLQKWFHDVGPSEDDIQ